MSPALRPALLFTLLLASCSNFHAVEPGRFYRSAQPTRIQLERWIDKYELKTVVILRGGRPNVKATREAAENKGIRFVQHKLRARRYPTKAQLLGLWKIFEEGEYPMLVHCQSGADRSGLASGVYLLWRSRSVEDAAGQLDFLPFGHTGWFGAHKLDEVFEMYRPFEGKLGFPEWVEKEYKIPGEDERSRPTTRPGSRSRPAA